jgi:prophage antirepressor-like protein
MLTEGRVFKAFAYQGKEVRTATRDGEPWWVLKDVCDILGLTTPARVAARLDDDEVSLAHLTDSIDRVQEISIINESGLYSVILRSDKPEAKAFKRWVTHEVLPDIRKHGMYIANELLSDNERLKAELAAYKAEKLALEKTVESFRDWISFEDINRVVKVSKCKTNFYNLRAASKKLGKPERVAKDSKGRPDYCYHIDVWLHCWPDMKREAIEKTSPFYMFRD